MSARRVGVLRCDAHRTMGDLVIGGGGKGRDSPNASRFAETWSDRACSSAVYMPPDSSCPCRLSVFIVRRDLGDNGEEWVKGRKYGCFSSEKHLLALGGGGGNASDVCGAVITRVRAPSSSRVVTRGHGKRRTWRDQTVQRLVACRELCRSCRRGRAVSLTAPQAPLPYAGRSGDGFGVPPSVLPAVLRDSSGRSWIARTTSNMEYSWNTNSRSKGKTEQ